MSVILIYPVELGESEHLVHHPRLTSIRVLPSLKTLNFRKKRGI